MIRWHHIAGAVVGWLMLTTGPALPAQAQTAPAQSGDADCVIVVGAPDPVTNIAPQETKACGAAAAEVALPAKKLIMTWYRNGDYGGGSTKIYGRNGGCGNYGIEFVGESWNDEIHSFRTYANCHYVRAFQNKEYGGWCYAYHGDARWVGNGVSSFWLSNSYKRC
ncbi:hypothetical protein ACQPZF_19875 [Actinosynnema sp. CS-041913]|uniref:hypothetical protein n=1 Tax=Actinosynnema sp. CS-041913 TaxID=3239917 RepID=UPI003D9035AA